MNTHKHLANPAKIEMTIGGKEVKIIDGVFCFSSTNGTSYNPTMHENKKEYLSSKGKRIETTGNVTVEIVETPDDKTKGSIRHVKKHLKKSQDEADPDKYTDDYVFLISNADNGRIASISFKGQVKDVQKIAPNKDGFPIYKVYIVIFDQDSFKVDK
jgi:hypothetical protein